LTQAFSLSLTKPELELLDLLRRRVAVRTASGSGKAFTMDLIRPEMRQAFGEQFWHRAGTFSAKLVSMGFIREIDRVPSEVPSRNRAKVALYVLVEQKQLET